MFTLPAPANSPSVHCYWTQGRLFPGNRLKTNPRASFSERRQAGDVHRQTTAAFHFTIHKLLLSVMSSNSLSDVLEKQIRSLCLKDFPCGEGRWVSLFISVLRRKRKKKMKLFCLSPETESADALLDLVSCPRSPWRLDEAWSPQAASLRRLAVLTPECLHTDFIHSYFTTLRIVNRDVSVVDDGLLKFSKLEELVLSANQISEIPAENLPATLKILELCANRLTSLSSLTRRPLPHLQHLGLSSNCLGSQEDISSLTGKHWPRLVSLDLSDCEFQHQQELLQALSSLPLLKTLVLEGNPLTLTPCYPGLAVDSLPQLSCLDSSWISPEERLLFKGFSEMNDVKVDVAAATVNVGRTRGIPDPATRVDDKAPDFPVVTYSYFITYEFLSHQMSSDMLRVLWRHSQKVSSETKLEGSSTGQVTEGGSSEAELQSDCDGDTLKTATEASSEESCLNAPHGIITQHITPALPDASGHTDRTGSGVSAVIQGPPHWHSETLPRKLKIKISSILSMTGLNVIFLISVKSLTNAFREPLGHCSRITLVHTPQIIHLLLKSSFRCQNQRSV
uniref:Leucine rich repeat containing 43 n=1 Tax=Salarias fasciatus TaxID=181472 RepID=A0A672JQM0_SALFA